MNKQVLIEGWREINHSYAMVNQYQLLELVKKGFILRHKDLPFFNSKWSSIKNDSGFSEADKSIIRSIKNPLDQQIFDTTYRISFPYRLYPSNSKRLLVFGTAEYQNIDGYIYNNQLQEGLDNRDLAIITPSNWSKAGFLNAGFEEERVFVVPHGVDCNTYKPISQTRRLEFRKALRVTNENFVILHVGAMTQNKGVDILVLAFAKLQSKYPHIRLILKDSSNLYDIRAKDVLKNLFQQNPKIQHEKVQGSVILISDNLTLNQLNGLYGSADCYVSPYRAEGFNLTPLEAAASGTPILITKGGATDDYFDQSFALQIESKRINDGKSTYLEPSVESLVENLSILIENKKSNLNKNFAQEFIKSSFSWQTATQNLANLF